MENGDAWPARYLLKIDSFSLLSDNGIDKYESSEFQSSGYKWKLIIYPNGEGNGEKDEDENEDEDEDVDGVGDHISVYLAIVGTSSLPADWEVNATFSFLIYDQIHDNYAVMRGMERRFRNIKTEWGFSECISHETFKDPSNGYLVNDKCIFGVDVYVIKNRGVGEYMSLLGGIKSYKHEWKISEFSKLRNSLFSDEFTDGSYKWKLQLYPNGDCRQTGQSISIYLVSVEAAGFGYGKRVKATYDISVKDQISGAHLKRTGGCWFSPAKNNRGWSTFMSLSELKDPNKGFLVNDCCVVEAEVSVLRIVKSLA